MKKRLILVGNKPFTRDMSEVIDTESDFKLIERIMD